MRVTLVLIGPPGSGKGTQAARIAQRYSIPHISTGDILRAAVRAGSDLGRQVAAILASGGLVDDQLITGLVRERLAAADTDQGFILDGYPRTVVQARALEGILGNSRIIVALIAVGHEEIIRRLGSRRVCKSCGITQSITADADEVTEPCPYCGGALVRRQDDDPATVRHRLEMYAAYAEPLIAHYRASPTFLSVDGLREPDSVTAALSTLIDGFTN
jgi:adenylate kinase